MYALIFKTFFKCRIIVLLWLKSKSVSLVRAFRTTIRQIRISIFKRRIGCHEKIWHLCLNWKTPVELAN